MSALDAVALTPNDYTLLAEMAVNAGRTLTYDHLLQRLDRMDSRGNAGRCAR